MSRGFVKEGDQEDVPIVVPRAFLPDGTPNYVTKSGLLSLNEERESLLGEREGCGDNYVKRNYLNACLEQLEARINNAVLRDIKETDKVDFGLWISYSVNGVRKHVRIVGVDEADGKKSLISFLSPMAKSLMGKREGDVLELSTPQGMKKVEIIKISTERPVDLKTEKKVKKNKISYTAPVSKSVIPETTIIKKEQTKSNDTPKQNISKIEILPLVNERGIIIGQAQRWQVHNGSKLLHPVVHLHVLNSKGEIYLQLRPTWKKIQPGKWDTAVGGHVSFGEKTEDALKREAEEEVGITGFKATKLKQYVWESNIEKELVCTFKTIYDDIISPSEETDGGRFWTREEIKESLGKGIFTPNLENELKKIPEIFL